MTYSRIDLIGQNGNEGYHYTYQTISTDLEGFIKTVNLTQEEKDFLYLVLDELAQRDKLINILRSDNELKQSIVNQHVLG